MNIKKESLLSIKGGLKIVDYIHETNTFKCVTDTNVVVYITGTFLQVNKQYVYELPSPDKDQHYNVALDLKYNIMRSVVKYINRTFQDGYDDESIDYQDKTYFPNKTRKIGADVKARNMLNKDAKNTDYRLYIVEYDKNFAENGVYSLIPAELHSDNADSEYYNPSSDELTIVKKTDTKTLSMRPQGQSWINASIEESVLTGKLIDIYYNVTTQDPDDKFRLSLFLDYEYITLIELLTYPSDTIVVYSVDGLLITTLLHNVIFYGD